MCLCGLIIAMIDAFCPLIGRNPMGKLPDVVRPLTKEKPGEKKCPMRMYWLTVAILIVRQLAF